MTTHGLKKPILYQFIMSGKSTKSEYQATIKRLIEHIRTKCKAEYVGAYEVGTEKGGLHCHMFVIVETLHHFPGDDILNVSAGNFIARRIKRTGMSITIEPPKNTMHGGAMFARMDTPAKLANCIEWATYILKVRSKDAVPGRETYFGSCHAANTRKREAVRQKYRDALTKSSKPTQTLAKEQDNEAKPTTKPETLPSFGSPADEEGASSREALVCTGQPTSPSEEARSQQEASLSHEPDCSNRAGPSDEGNEMILTAQQKYLAGLYEQCIDADMDTNEIRRYLLEKGVVRTPGTVAWELEHVFCFTGYADSHPPKPVICLADWLRNTSR